MRTRPRLPHNVMLNSRGNVVLFNPEREYAMPGDSFPVGYEDTVVFLDNWRVLVDYRARMARREVAFLAAVARRKAEIAT